MDIYNNSYYRFTKGQKREAVLANTMIRKFNANDWRLKYLYKHVDSSFTNFGIHVQNPQYTIDVSGNINNTLDYYHNGYLLVPVGMISPYAGPIAPNGWFICDGASYSRTDYHKLFGVIGTLYGSVDGNSFNIPNLKGRVPFGYNSSNGLFDVSGNTGGSSTTTLTINELPAHTHTGTTASNGTHTHTGTTDVSGNHTHTSNATGNYGITVESSGGDNTVGNPDTSIGELDVINNYDLDIYSSGSHSHTLNINSSGAHTHTFTTDSSGNGQAFSIMPPYIVLQYIIRHGRNDV